MQKPVSTPWDFFKNFPSGQFAERHLLKARLKYYETFTNINGL